MGKSGYNGVEIGNFLDKGKLVGNWDDKAVFPIYKWEEVNIMAIICIFKEDEEDEEEDSSKKED